MRLPDFIGIGAEKCATSWLFQILSEHPDVFLPRMKEVQFFDKRYDQGLEWYADFFDDKAKYVGEVTPQYIHDPECAKRIANDVPDAKFFLMLRNPIDRAYSHYWMYVRKNKALGDEILPFEQAIKSDLSFLEKGLYYKQLNDYLKYFPLDQFMILFQEEIKKSPLEFCQNIYTSLGVDNTIVPDSLNQKVNTAGDFKNPVIFRFARMVSQTMKKIGLEPLVLWLENKGIHELFFFEDKAYDYPPMDKTTREELKDYYAEPNKQLADLLGCKLPPNWQE